MIFALALLTLSAPPADRPDRTFEGNWFVSDDTDNNTGERKVYAFQTYLKRSDPDYVTLTMRCSGGAPTFFVDWQDQTFPDQAVITLGPVKTSDSEPQEARYVFEKSQDVLKSGMRASPETSRQIVAAIGTAPYLVVTAYLTSGQRSVEIDVKGTQSAWDRVVRHCPVRRMERPPE